MKKKFDNIPDYINEDDVEKEVTKYSITPQTLRHRKFTNVKIEDLESEQKIISNRLANLNTEHSNITRSFSEIENSLTSINTQVTNEGEFRGSLNEVKSKTSELTQKIISKISETERYQAMFKQFRDFTDKYKELTLTFIEQYKPIDNEVQAIRYGINTIGLKPEQVKDLINIFIPIEQKVKGSQSIKSGGTGSTKSSGKDNKKDIMLTPLEIIILKDAIEHIKSEDNNNTNNSERAVLVDIFAREGDGSIKIEKDGVLEIHTIVIFKNLAQEYLVIDPNNSNFSKHLGYNSLMIFGNNEAKIVTPSKELKIYTSIKENTGSGPDQYRDCIDITVKIAFGLNKVQGPIDIQNIGTIEVIQEITNNQYMNLSLSSVENDPLRIKQASSSDIREKANNILKKLALHQKVIEEYNASKELKDIFNNQFTEIVKKNYEPHNYNQEIKDLLNCYLESSKSFAEYISDSAEAYSREILGQNTDGEKVE